MQVILLSVVIFCSARVKSTAYKDDGNDVVIVRGEKDRFTRKLSCNESKAVCFNESCTYCQCTEGQTFVRSRSYHGECFSNELLVYATSEYFLLDNHTHQSCLTYTHGGRDNFVYKSKSCSRENWKQRWIWTKHKQLLNWESLECMTDDYNAIYHYVTMKKCNRTDQKQFWNCERKNNNELIRQTQSGRYMHYGEHGGFVTTTSISSDVWARFRSGKQVCSQAVGCETFADGSSIIILNKTKCEENLDYSGEKEIELRKTSCSLLPHKIQYLHNDTWKPLEMKNGSFSIKTMEKVSLQKTPEKWAGLLVKVQFSCEDTPGSNNSASQHCVVIKYTGTFKGFHGSNSDKYCIPHRNKNSINESSDDSGTDDGTDGSQNDENKPTVNQESNGGDKDSPKTIIIFIIVCVLLVLLLTGVVVFIRCRYKNSHGRTRSNEGDKASEDQHQAAVVLPLDASDHEFELSTTNQPTQRDSRACEVANNHPRNNPEESIEPEATGGNVIPQTDIEGSTHDEVYVNERPDIQEGNTHDAGCVIERPDTDPQGSPNELRDSHLYESCEYPDQSPSHEYDYPSVMNMRADIAGRTDDDGYSALIRPPFNRNESENGVYTSLIKGQQTSENSGTTGKEDDAGDRSSYVNVDPNNSDYTPLVRTPLKDNESESSHYEPLLTNGQITPKKPM